VNPTRLVVVNDPADWPIDVPGLRVVAARDYLTDPYFIRTPRLKVFNLCRSYRYQKTGYYVSLLATARGHRPMPSVGTIQGLKSPTILRVAADELEDLVQRSLAPIQSDEFTLSIYFGRNVAKRHDRLGAALYRQFEAPLLRATFTRTPRNGDWQLAGVQPIAVNEIHPDHHDFLLEVVTDHFKGRRRARAQRVARYELAILHDPDEVMPPSDEPALKRFVRAAETEGFGVEMITGDDYGRLAEFDALFIRETTSVNHRTYRFAQRGEAEGLVVVDDPESIIRCSNKVFLAETLAQRNIPAPRTFIVHRANRRDLLDALGLPCILKQPDSAFSQGVVKAETEAELEERLTGLLERSDLVVAQEFLPTDFDWRIGIFDRRPLYACRYFMARRHWQIIRHDGRGGSTAGRVETVPIERAPRGVVRAARGAADLIGDGLYGVDVKMVRGTPYVIEVNDNPTIEAGVEDEVLGPELYARIMRGFRERVDQRTRGAAIR
jgi:glutathione synthase/RimK-type ligase-like ATP-grasp enzyme